jgi:polyhydroxyalkanoate synthesis regulator phasin
LIFYTILYRIRAEILSGKHQSHDYRRRIFMLSEEARKIFLAGLGAVAVTAEKSKQLVDELVKKGELTMEQGKVLNEELRHNVAQKVKEHVTVNVTGPCDVESVKAAIGKMSPEELKEIKAKIAKAESSSAAQKAPAAEDAAGNQEDAGK